MRQHIRRWFGVAFWLVTVLGLCGWLGGSALPSLASRDTAGPLCSTAASVSRTRPAPSQLLALRAGPVDSIPGMPIVADSPAPLPILPADLRARQYCFDLPIHVSPECLLCNDSAAIP